MHIPNCVDSNRIYTPPFLFSVYWLKGKERWGRGFALQVEGCGFNGRDCNIMLTLLCYASNAHSTTQLCSLICSLIQYYNISRIVWTIQIFSFVHKYGFKITHSFIITVAIGIVNVVAIYACWCPTLYQ